MQHYLDLSKKNQIANKFVPNSRYLSKKTSNSRRICTKLIRSKQKIRHRSEQNSRDLSKTYYIVAGSECKRRDLTKSGGDFMDLDEISPNLKILADKCYVSQLVRVLGRRSETEPTRLDSEKKDPPQTAGVVRSADGRPDSG